MEDQWNVQEEDRGLTLEELRGQAAECARQAMPAFEAVLGKKTVAPISENRMTPRVFVKKAVRKLWRILWQWIESHRPHDDAWNREGRLETLENQKVALLAEKYAGKV